MRPPSTQQVAHKGRAQTAGSGLNGYTLLIAIVGASAGLLFGFDIAVINGAMVFVRQQFALSNIQTEIAASSLLAGCVIGASLAGFLSDSFGRRKVLLGAAALFALSSLGTALPHRLGEFVLARMLAGLATGTASLLAPLYIAEVSPARVRGRLVALDQLSIVAGVLGAYIINYVFSANTQNGWRWMFAIASAPALALCAGLLFVPESPRWLIKARRYSKARETLSRIMGPAEAEEEFTQIESTVLQESGSFSDLFSKPFRRPMGIGIALAILQQITGANTVLYYGSIILGDQVGLKRASSAIGLNVGVGVIMLLSTIFAMFLIDRLGRKPLLLASSGGMALSLIVMGLAFRSTPPSAVTFTAAMFSYVFCYSFGLAPVVWVLLAELFPTSTRGRAMAISTVALWLACLLLTATFLSLVELFGPSNTFWLYGAISVFTFGFVFCCVPETKGKSLELIERMWT
jgi:sugar porter (SP) family MFS transporter